LNFGGETVSDKVFKLAIILLFILVTLGLSSYYLDQPVELRKGAYFAEASVLMQPQKEVISLGEELLVNVFLDSSQEKLSAVNLAFNYDPGKINFVGERVAGGLKIPVSETVKIKRDEEQGRVEIARIAKRTTAELPTGSNLFTQLVFEPLVVGEVGLGLDNIQLVGFNQALDKNEPDVAFQAKGDKEISVEVKDSQTEAEVEVKLKIKLKGVDNPQTSEILVDLKIGRGTEILRTYENLTAQLDHDGYLTLESGLPAIQPGEGYFFLIKPKGALQRKICSNPQRDHCRMDGGAISLKKGINEINAEYDRVDMGNVNDDRVLNSQDFSIIKANLTGKGNDGDVDLNGVVNTRDIVIFLHSLSEIYDEDY
jgi:hypothetical protein